MAFVTGPSGIPIAYDLDLGTADPSTGIVFLHGFASIRHGEKAALLRDRCRVLGWSCLVFDARGHGESGGSFKDLTVSGYLEDARAVIAGPGAGLRRILLVGSSLGGLVALHLAARTPGGFAGCVALAPALRFAERHLAAAGAEGARKWRESGVRRLRNDWIEVDVGWEFIADGLSFKEDELVAKLATPTLIIHGMQDEVVPVRGSTDFALRFARPGVDLVLIGEGDHRLNTVKARVQSIIEEFAHRLFADPSSR